MSKIQNQVFNVMSKVHVWDLWRYLNPDTLTVLNYHRIADPDGQDAFFKPNISATPAMFDLQLEYLEKNFNIISVNDLISWLDGEKDLPERAALITFDDGYQDNYIHAYPALSRRWLPAVIFLATGYIENNKPFYWDLLAYAMSKTRKDHLSLRFGGTFQWETDEERDGNIHPLVEALKYLTDDQKLQAVDEVISLLDVPIPNNLFDELFLTWDQVREMAKDGIEMGGHSVNHPILTRVPPKVAANEIVGCKKKIEEATGRHITSFAYPNGQQGDYNKKLMAFIKKTGYEVAFSLRSGPQEYNKVKNSRYAIRRVFLSYRDTLPRFVAKLYGMPRLFERMGKGMG